MRLLSVIRRLPLIFALTPALVLSQFQDLQRYREGQAALDALRWQPALESLKNTPSDSAQAPGALYWKAFALLKLGRGDDALAALGELRRAFPQSGWLGDAQTLESAIRAAGRGPSPSKDLAAEARLRALDASVRNNPDHAVATLRDAALQPNLPGVRQKAFYELSRNRSPEAHKVVLEVADGRGNPDLQLYALSMLGKTDPQALSNIYPSADEERKGFILTVLATNREKDRLAQIAGAEASNQLRSQALGALVDVGTDAQVARLIQSEKSADVKRFAELAVASLHKWLEQKLTALRTSPDAKLRRSAAVGLSRGGDESTTRALVAAYASEKDPAVKGAIVFTLAQRKDFAALTAMEGKETDPTLKARMLQERRLEESK